MNTGMRHTFGKFNNPDMSLFNVARGLKFLKFHILEYDFYDNKYGIQNINVYVNNTIYFSNFNNKSFIITNLSSDTNYDIKAEITLNNSSIIILETTSKTVLLNSHSFFNDVDLYIPFGNAWFNSYEQEFINIFDYTRVASASNILNNYDNSVNGFLNKSTKFNGNNNNEAYLNSPTLLNTNQSFSIAFLIKLNASNSDEGIITQYKPASSSNRRWGLRFSNNRLSHWQPTGGGTSIGNTNINDGLYHIVFIVQDFANNSLKYYLDNQLEISTIARNFETNTRTTFGGWDNFGGMNAVINLEGFLFKNEAFTQSDRDYLYNNGNYRNIIID